ncbi:MAG: hypothetical protein ACI9X0_002711 [Kiritimatiellia bacterium]|jgi:hypothetical protein
MFKQLRKRLPWNRPSLMDLPRDERRRIKALMLGAGIPARPDGDGKIRIAFEETPSSIED